MKTIRPLTITFGLVVLFTSSSAPAQTLSRYDPLFYYDPLYSFYQTVLPPRIESVQNISQIVSINRSGNAATVTVRTLNSNRDIYLRFTPGWPLPYPYGKPLPITDQGAQLMLKMLEAARSRGHYISFTSMWVWPLNNPDVYYATASTLAVFAPTTVHTADPWGLVHGGLEDNPGSDYYGWLYLRKADGDYRYFLLLKREVTNDCGTLQPIPLNDIPHVGVLNIIENAVGRGHISIGTTCRDPARNKIVHNGSVW